MILGYDLVLPTGTSGERGEQRRDGTGGDTAADSLLHVVEDLSSPAPTSSSFRTSSSASVSSTCAVVGMSEITSDEAEDILDDRTSSAASSSYDVRMVHAHGDDMDGSTTLHIHLKHPPLTSSSRACLYLSLPGHLAPYLSHYDRSRDDVNFTPSGSLALPGTFTLCSLLTLHDPFSAKAKTNVSSRDPYPNPHTKTWTVRLDRRLVPADLTPGDMARGYTIPPPRITISPESPQYMHTTTMVVAPEGVNIPLPYVDHSMAFNVPVMSGLVTTVITSVTLLGMIVEKVSSGSSKRANRSHVMVRVVALTMLLVSMGVVWVMDSVEIQEMLGLEAYFGAA
jgi:hypothetical protein